jgi:uncharacterized protein
MNLFLDANIVIYALESLASWGSLARTRLAIAQAAGDTFTISDLVRMECLVLPIRQGNTTVAAQYRAFFARGDVTVASITAAVCDRAARIRATHNFKAMDALQLAAAVEHGANVFLTADARLRSFTGLTVEVLS